MCAWAYVCAYKTGKIISPFNFPSLGGRCGWVARTPTLSFQDPVSEGRVSGRYVSESLWTSRGVALTSRRRRLVNAEVDRWLGGFERRGGGGGRKEGGGGGGKAEGRGGGGG